MHSSLIRENPVDYPWEALGSATFVDVGGGVGEFSFFLFDISISFNN